MNVTTFPAARASKRMMMAGMAAAGNGRTDAGALPAADRDATLSELHRAHYRSLVRLACILLDERGAGEEAVQEAFVRVYDAWDRIDDPLTYLRATVMNLARSRMRRRLVARRRTEPIVRPAMSAEEHVVLLADQQAVLEAVRALPRRQRECIVLRYYLELSEAEIAATLGISPGSVKSHSHRGIAALATRLEDTP
jgi:RNA polymerase sigma-70 factor (sigma-E family)